MTSDIYYNVYNFHAVCIVLLVPRTLRRPRRTAQQVPRTAPPRLRTPQPRPPTRPPGTLFVTCLCVFDNSVVLFTSRAESVLLFLLRYTYCVSLSHTLV